MPNLPRNQRLTPRGILSVESLENRRLLSGEGFWQLLPYYGFPAPTFEARVDQFLRDNGLTVQGWFQQGTAQGVSQTEDARREGIPQEGSLLNLGARDFSAFVGLSKEEVRSLVKAIDQWANADPVRVDSRESPTAEHAKGAAADGLSARFVSGNKAGNPGQETKAESTLTQSRSEAAKSAADLTQALMIASPATNTQVPLDSLHAETAQPGSLDGAAGQAIPSPTYFKHPSSVSQNVVEPRDLLSNPELPPPAQRKSSSGRSEFAAQADQLFAVSQLLESARSGEPVRIAEQLAALGGSRSELTASDPAVATLLQRQDETPHNGSGTAEHHSGAAIHLGQGLLNVEEQADARVRIGLEGTGEAAGDRVALAPQGSNIFLNGLAVDTATLERALKQFLNQVNDLGEELSKSLQLMGGSPWLMGLAVAGTAYEVVRRQQKRGKRKKGLASGEGRRTLTWIAGLPGSLSVEES